MAKSSKSQANEEQLRRQEEAGQVQSGTPNSDDQLPTSNGTVGNPFEHSNDGMGRAYDPAVDGEGKAAEKAQREADAAPEE